MRPAMQHPLAKATQQFMIVVDRCAAQTTMRAWIDRGGKPIAEDWFKLSNDGPE